MIRSRSTAAWKSPNEPGIGNEISQAAFDNAAEYAVIE